MVGSGPQRILVVDDEPLVCESLKLMLNACGYAVELAHSGEEALAQFDLHSFEVVLTDLRMAGMSGDQLARAVKARDPATAVIMLTGFHAKDPPPGVDLMLLKPCSLQSVRQALETVLLLSHP